VVFDFLAFAVGLLVGRADERAFNEHVSTFLDVASHVVCQAWPEQNFAVPLCLTVELHSSSAFFHERCVATESTVNLEPLPFA